RSRVVDLAAHPSAFAVFGWRGPLDPRLRRIEFTGEIEMRRIGADRGWDFSKYFCNFSTEPCVVHPERHVDALARKRINWFARHSTQNLRSHDEANIRINESRAWFVTWTQF